MIERRISFLREREPLTFLNSLGQRRGQDCESKRFDNLFFAPPPAGVMPYPFRRLHKRLSVVRFVEQDEAVGCDEGGVDCAERGYLLIPGALMALFQGDAASARKLSVEVAELGERFRSVHADVEERRASGELGFFELPYAEDVVAAIEQFAEGH